MLSINGSSGWVGFVCVCVREIFDTVPFFFVSLLQTPVGCACDLTLYHLYVIGKCADQTMTTYAMENSPFIKCISVKIYCVIRLK